MKFITIFYVLLLALVATVAAEKSYIPVCETCPEGQIKYYSVDRLFNRCGECCMEPEKFNLYKVFEIGLTKAEDNNPCEKLGYSEFENAETHGFFNIKMTLDKYRKPKKSYKFWNRE
eukprot:jgi/Orpsp1_1/1184526/evm.model.c7180000089887.1